MSVCAQPRSLALAYSKYLGTAISASQGAPVGLESCVQHGGGRMEMELLLPHVSSGGSQVCHSAKAMGTSLQVEGEGWQLQGGVARQLSLGTEAPGKMF